MLRISMKKLRIHLKNSFSSLLNRFPGSKTYYRQNRRPELFYKKGVLKNSAKFTRKYLCQSLLFNKVAGSDRCFPVNCAKFLRTFLFIEHFRWLLLYRLRLQNIVRCSSPEVFLGKGALKICSKFSYRRTPMPKSDFNKVARNT